MVKIINILKDIAFWGFIFLLTLVIGFKVDIQTIKATALSGIRYANIVCIYYLVSVVIYPLSFIIYIRMVPGLSLAQHLSLEFQDNMCVPFRGFNLKELFEIKDMGLDKSGILYDIFAIIYNLVRTIIWYIVALFCWSELIRLDTPVNSKIMSQTPTQIVVIVGCVFAVYIIVMNISVGINYIVWKRWRDYEASIVKRDATPLVPA